MKIQRKGNSKTSPCIITKEIVEYVTDLYVNKRMGMANIGKEIGASPSTVMRILHGANVHIRTDREQALKYSVDENYFETIDDEHKAYWFGLMYSDGFIQKARKYNSRKIGISLNIEDKPLLEKFKEDLKFTGDVKEYKVSSGFKVGAPYCRLLISNEKLASDLESKGCVEQKSTILKFPENKVISNDLMWHFLRGFIDGDGSIMLKHRETGCPDFVIGITSTKEMLEGIKKFLGKENLKLSQRYPDRNNNIYSLQIGGNFQAADICRNLYKDATIFMERKHDKYIQFLKEYEQYSRAN